MAWNLFGFNFKRKGDQKQDLKSFVAPDENDGAIVIDNYGLSRRITTDVEGIIHNDIELINKYRTTAAFPECNKAIGHIIEDSIISENNEPPVEIETSDKLDDEISEIIRNEFEEIQWLLNFQEDACELYKTWFVDGRLYFHILIDETDPRAGIQELRYIDPRLIKPIREIKTEPDPITGIQTVKIDKEYFMFDPTGSVNNTTAMGPLTITSMAGTLGVPITKDSICYIHSGIVDPKNDTVLSHMHQAIKPVNQLRMIEDAVVIYRLVRAPERRAFYIDVANMSPPKAEAYMKKVIERLKGDLLYDPSTGEIRDAQAYRTMQEDYFLPRRNGNTASEITSLPGGRSLSEMDDVLYFKKNLFESLYVPITRMSPENGFNLGKSSEITRDELIFYKFIKRLRNRFSYLFYDLLEKQLLLKGICDDVDWEEIKPEISFNWKTDSYFEELKEMEVMQQRNNLARDLDPDGSKYFSRAYIKKEVYKLTDEQIEELNEELEKEKEEEPLEPEGAGGMGGDLGGDYGETDFDNYGEGIGGETDLDYLSSEIPNTETTSEVYPEDENEYEPELEL